MNVLGLSSGFAFLVIGSLLLRGRFKTLGSLFLIKGLILFFLTLVLMLLGVSGFPGVLFLLAIIIVLLAGSLAWAYFSYISPFEGEGRAFNFFPLIPSLIFFLISIPLLLWGHFELPHMLRSPITGDSWLPKPQLLLSFAGLEVLLLLISFLILLFLAKGYMVPKSSSLLLFALPNLPIPAHIILLLFLLNGIWYNLYGERIFSIWFFLGFLFLLGVIFPLIFIFYFSLRVIRGR